MWSTPSRWSDASHALRTYSGRAVDAEAIPALVADVAELGGEHDLVAPAPDRLADELLVRERAVHVGGVEEVDAEVERAVDGRDGLGVVAAAVELGHAHAAEAEGGDGEAIGRACAAACDAAPKVRQKSRRMQGRKFGATFRRLMSAEDATVAAESRERG